MFEELQVYQMVNGLESPTLGKLFWLTKNRLMLEGSIVAPLTSKKQFLFDMRDKFLFEKERERE